MSLTPPPVAPTTSDPSTFDARGDAHLAWQAVNVAEENILLASLSSIAAGGGFSLPYTFSSTTNSDPGPGGIRLSSATQNASTILRVDLISALGADVTAMLDSFDDSTSAVKGQVRMVKVADPTKWLSFNLTGTADPGGYRNFTVAHVSGSAASPFTNGDELVLFFTRTGDKGDTGTAGVSGFSNMVVYRTTTTPVTFPAGVVKAKITVIDGGYAGDSIGAGGGPGGKGGDASVSVITVSSAVNYTATVGAGGTAPSGAGGASSFSGSGITTLTSAAGTLVAPGMPGQNGLEGFSGVGGASLFGSIGGGGAAGTNGTVGAVIIEY